jgi:hypothetical protein
MIANIALDDGLILAHSANPTGPNFRERHPHYHFKHRHGSTEVDAVAAVNRDTIIPNMMSGEYDQCVYRMYGPPPICKWILRLSSAGSAAEGHRSVRHRDADRRDRTMSPYFATSASHSVHPVGVRQHVEAHQSKDNEHNYGGHDPHYAHFGFFFLLILVCHGFLLFCSRALLSPLLGAAATLQVI